MNCLGLLLLGMCLRGTAFGFNITIPSDPWKILDPARQVDKLCGSCSQGVSTNTNRIANKSEKSKNGVREILSTHFEL